MFNTTQNGGYGGSGNGFGGATNYGNNKSNGQSNFSSGQTGAAFTSPQNFKPPPQFGGAQGGPPPQNGMNRGQFPFTQPSTPQQPPPPPMMPFPMPPQFPQ